MPKRQSYRGSAVKTSYRKRGPVARVRPQDAVAGCCEARMSWQIASRPGEGNGEVIVGATKVLLYMSRCVVIETEC